jgi:hypothetical protein
MSERRELTRGQVDMIELAALRAKPVFDAMGWTHGDDDHSPSVQELREMITDLVRSALRGGVAMTRRGRFTVTKDRYGGLDDDLAVSLELAQWWPDDEADGS